MAHLILSDGSKQTCTPETGVLLWQILNGQVEATEDQAKFSSKVKRVFLNWRNETTPDDYIEAHLDGMKELCTNSWIVSRAEFKLLKPEPNDKRSWYLAKKYHWLNY